MTARYAALGLRIAAVLVVLAAPFAPPLAIPDDDTTIVFVVDRSPSIPVEDRARADAFMRDAERANPRASIGVVELDRDARATRWPGHPERASMEPSEIAGTDLAGGVRLGAALLPEGGRRRLVILSDGRGTTPGIERAVDRARANGIVVDVVPIGDSVSQTHIVELGALQHRLAPGEPFEATAEVAGAPSARAILRWTRDGAWLTSSEVVLDARGRGTAAIADPSPPDGVHVYEAELVETAQRERVLADVAGRPRVLVVTLTDRERPTLLMRALEEVGEVRIHALAQGPVPIDRIRDSDLVVLSDLPLAQPGTDSHILSGLDVETQHQLVEYVSEEGGGLIVGGGAFGFGPDWVDHPISRALPVAIEDQGELQDPPVAMAIMLDGSGSMGLAVGGYTKIRLAAEGSLAAASTLRPEDRLAMGVTEEHTRWIQRLAPSGVLEENRDHVRALQAGSGGIFVYTSLRDAYAELEPAPEAIRHVILFSDTEDSEEQFEGCVYGACAGHSAIDLAREARGTGITTTVVGIGDAGGRDVGFLTQLAAAGGGRYYVSSNGTDLSRIFVTETRAVARSNLREETALPVPSDPSPLLDGIGELPALAGFVQTRRRETASTALSVADDRPLLASWRYGVGTVVAFTSDLGGRWSQSWGDSERGPQLLRQMVRHAMRRRSARAEISVALEGRTAEITIDVADGTTVDAERLSVRALSAFGEPRELTVRVERAGPNRYRAIAQTDGEELVIARLNDEDGREMAEASGQDRSQRESRGIGPDARALREIARRGGGRVLSSPAQVMRRGATAGSTRVPSWPLLFVLAAVLVAIDLFVRRLARPKREALASVPQKDVARPEKQEIRRAA